MTRFFTLRRSEKVARAAVRRPLGERSGGVTLMVALTVVPIVAMLGLAIDLSFITQSKAQLNAAADAAALAAVKTSADAFAAGKHDYATLGQEAGLQWFRSQSAAIVDTRVQVPTVEVKQSGPTLSSTVSYQSGVSTPFAHMFGIGTIPIGGRSSATITTAPYVSVTFLLDNSSSMLLAATEAGVDLMNTLTPSQAKVLNVPNGLGGVPCAFACHWDSRGQDYYGIARNNRILLRLDVLQLAVQSAIIEMMSNELITDQFAIAIFMFDEALTQLYPSDLDRATSIDLMSGVAAAQRIQTPLSVYRGNTNFSAVMASLAGRSAAAGDGSSPAKPKKALIVITDGIVDYASRAIPSTRGPFDPASCAAVKRLGYEVYLLYTTYITTPPNLLLPGDNIDLLPFARGTTAPELLTSLQLCVSAPTNLVQATDSTGIAAAIKRMLQATVGNGVRFTE